MSTLATLLFGFMLLLVPVSQQPESTEETIARYSSIAADIDAVVSREDEPALFPGADGKVKTALLLVSIAYSESAFFKRVDEDHCLPRECDAGNAKGLWQVQPGMGLAFDGDGWKYDRKGFHGRDLIKDRRLMIRMVLHLLRGPHGADWADGKRLERALAYLAAHPIE